VVNYWGGLKVGVFANDVKIWGATILVPIRKKIGGRNSLKQVREVGYRRTNLR
jgi:hypothetical protein